MNLFFAKSSMLTNRNLSIFLLFISLLAYGNTINNRYALDDLVAITENDYVKQGIKAIPNILTTPYHKGYKRVQDTGALDNLYRPLSLVTFAIEYQFFKKNPAEAHLVNILLFAACVIVLFLFLDRVFERKRTGVAFIAALLFAVHPIHTEVVANIKSRDELMCFLLGIGALLLFIKYARSGKAGQLLAGCICLFLSLLSKETSISFLLIVPLVFFFFINENRQRSIYITVSVLLTCVLYLVMRFVSLKLHNGTDTQIDFIDNELGGSTSFTVRIATAFFVLGYYIRLLFVPYPLICDYAYKSLPLASVDDPLALLSFGIYLFLAIYGLYRLFKYKKDVWAFGILFFLITIVLFSNILFLIGAVMAERFVFFASVGFCLSIAQLLWSRGTKNMEEKSLFAPKIWLILTPICALFIVLTIYRNAEWKDNYVLFSSDVKKAPEDSRLWANLGYETAHGKGEAVEGQEVGKLLLEEGISYYETCLLIYPPYINARKDLADIYIKIRRYDLAEEQYKKVLELSTKNKGAALSDLGYIYFIETKYKEAIQLCRQSLIAVPNSITTYNNMVICYTYAGQYDSAIMTANKALQIEPGNVTIKGSLALAVKGQEQAKNADTSTRK